MEVSSENKKLVYAPYGFARGFCALSDDCEVQYKCTGLYNSAGESGIFYKDAQVVSSGPSKDVVVSEKDARAQSLRSGCLSDLEPHCVRAQLGSHEERGCMRILIAGGAGYIGAALIPQLLDRGYGIDVVDLFWFGQVIFRRSWNFSRRISLT